MSAKSVAMEEREQGIRKRPGDHLEIESKRCAMEE